MPQLCTLPSSAICIPDVYALLSEKQLFLGKNGFLSDLADHRF
jgi:hypothetical protein